MLDAFLSSQRDTILSRARARVASRTTSSKEDGEAIVAIPTFLDQLADAVRGTGDRMDRTAIRATAALRGRALLRMGLDIAELVHGYGDVIRVIYELAAERDVHISATEHRTLNACTYDAIAGAVSEYLRHRELAIEQRERERLGTLAHELRNQLNTASLTFDVLRSGRQTPNWSADVVHGRALNSLRDLIERSLAEARPVEQDGAPPRESSERISVADLVEQVQVEAEMQARVSGLDFAVTKVDRALTIDGDRRALAGMLYNLLQNAFKFTRTSGRVSLQTRGTLDRVLFDIEDECGGLPAGIADDLFLPFVQRSADRSGVGLGLSICVKTATASGGEIRVRDKPGQGCIFTLDLPRLRGPGLSHTNGSAPRRAAS